MSMNLEAPPGVELIEDLSEEFRDNAVLFKVEDGPISFKDSKTRTDRTKGTYFVVAEVEGYESQVFPATEEGEVTSYLGLDGCRRDDNDLQESLNAFAEKYL